MRSALAAAVLATLLLPALVAAQPAQTAACRRANSKIEALERRIERARGGPRPQRLARLDRLTRKHADKCVRLNQVQVLATHNSYHIEPVPPLLAALKAFAALFEQIEFTHVPLAQQFSEQGIRAIEIDVFADPMGGLFSRRGGLLAIGEDPESGIPELDEPGFKVFHIQDIDFRSVCLTFTECLEQVRDWSDANPGHLPLMIQIEAKDDVIPDVFGFGFAVPIPIGTAEFDALDAEIRAVFPAERLITPDDVRQGMSTLEQGVLVKGWPTLGEARGRVLFTLDNEGDKRAAYRDGHPNLEGRILFTPSAPGQPDAAFIKANDPEDDPGRIPALVAAGYVVRTRADGDTIEARSGDTTQRDAAIASGAQWVSTDYPVPDPRFGTGYFVAIPDASPARCNPVNAPPGCRSTALE
ncbi:MAG TPA: phosphatidylinositol-specific phospholipase C1-like protein [Candidatus Binatia bacterium]|nr:phosphatidylinositol-specific phospholipase C1-like protein [Candidatus Binatia bacterium]